jgi:branched-chain amino acid transport system substrate-binding protein
MERGRALLALLIALEACGKAPGGGAAAVTFGAIFPETASQATTGFGNLHGAQLAVDEINAAGGLLGGTLKLEVRNDGSDPAVGGAAAQDLIDHLHVPAIVGSNTSAVTLAVAEVTDPAHVILMSPAATSPRISTLADDDFVFRTVPSDVLLGQLLSERARALGLARVAVLHEPGPYGTDLGAAFADDFARHGGTITDVVAYMVGRQSYQDVLASIYATHPEAILFPAFTADGSQVIRDYVLAFAYQQTFWLFTDGVQNNSFVAAVGGSNFTFRHEGAGPAAATGDAFTTFERAYKAKFDQDPTPRGPHTYDAVYVLALAVVHAGRADATAIRDSLRQVTNPPGMQVGPGQFAEAAAAIQAGTKINSISTSVAMRPPTTSRGASRTARSSSRRRG